MRMIESGKIGRYLPVLYDVQYSPCPKEIRARYPGVHQQILTHHSLYMLLFSGTNLKRSLVFKVYGRYQPLLHRKIVAMANIQNAKWHPQSHLSASFCE